MAVKKFCDICGNEVERFHAAAIVDIALEGGTRATVTMEVKSGGVYTLELCEACIVKTTAAAVSRYAELEKTDEVLRQRGKYGTCKYCGNKVEADGICPNNDCLSLGSFAGT